MSEVLRVPRDNGGQAKSPRRQLVASGDHARFSEVTLAGLEHSFENSVALRGVDLTVGGGKFVTLLGPSGSGKTTLLRVIAGLLVPTAGKVFIDGKDVSTVPTQRRDIGFVFQSYALFPHLTVAQNIAFPLRMRKVPRSAQRHRVAEMLELVSLVGLEGRYPGQLSGGQQQRVALARALAHAPKLLLLDEPLGALDRRLRQQLGGELRRIQREAAVTAIYVTHDQEEAFVLSDRIVIMHDGRVLQDGTPVEIYTQPADAFVANFVGETNLLSGRVVDVQQDVAMVDVGGEVIECTCHEVVSIGSMTKCFLRPEQISVSANNGASRTGTVRFLGTAVTEDRIFLGGRYRLILNLYGSRLTADVDLDGYVPDPGSSVLVGCAPLAPTIIVDRR